MGGSEVLQGSISLGDLAKVLVYQMALGGRIGVIGQITNILQNSSSAAQRVYELLDPPPSPEPQRPPGRIAPIQGAIAFEEVAFQHVSEPSLRVLDETKPQPPENRPPAATPSRTQALEGLSFTIPAGSTVAVVGPTGCGKSTLLALIARFYEPTHGRILLDDIDLRDWDRDTLRQSIGMVFQETFLFSATLAENISLGRPQASRDEIEAAARAARADGFIRELPQGYDTVIGERGISLSGGQRQRIAIARALLIQPRIVLLDDATSAVDPSTEEEIREAMRELCRGRTTFLVAHRAATICTADQILVLQDGKLVAQGRHESLLADCSLYQELFAKPEPQIPAH
jgi:ATP-binding cassette subfamily B protein